MKTTAILDRSYAFYLPKYLTYFAEGKNEKKYTNEELCFFNVINWASILFDKILIEDYYASSLYNLTSKNDSWFWNIFELYSPDKIMADDAEFFLTLEDSIICDINNNKLLKIIKKELNPQYRDTKRIDSLIRNINRTLFLAKKIDAVIIPSIYKMPLYQQKFEQNLFFNQESESEKILKTVFSSEIPLFDINNLSQLIEIKNNKKLKYFRKYIWGLSNQEYVSEIDILQSLNNDKTAIIEQLLSQRKGFLEILISSKIPFPLNLIGDGLNEVINHCKMKEFSWYFFLLDAKSKNQNNE